MRTSFLAAIVVPLLTPALHAQYELSTEFGLGMDDGAITPNGRWGIIRENQAKPVAARVYDMRTGALVVRLEGLAADVWTGPCQDAVVCTDERAAVIGSSLLLIDLTTMTTVATPYVGNEPRDLEITPDGELLVIRGGYTGGGLAGGLFVFDLASGQQLLYHPGEPSSYAASHYSFDVDSVATTNTHAVFTSFYEVAGGPMTRVTVVRLRPPADGPPVVVYETDSATDQLGAPHDITITPDGRYAAVRSELRVGLYRLAGGATQQLWVRNLFALPGPFGDSALDSIESSNERIVTISRASNGFIGAQIDVFNLSGQRWHDRVLGDPHDFALSPDGTRAFMRSSWGMHMYDIVNFPALSELTPLDQVELTSTHTSWGAGMDSVMATGELVAALARVDFSTEIRVWDWTSDRFEERIATTMPERPVDLTFTPAERLLCVTGLSYFMALDVVSDRVVFEFDPARGSGWPWCDGVVADDDAALAFGYTGGQSGWVSVIDLFSKAESYCETSPNSVGPGGRIFATGSPSLASNDLALVAHALPPGFFGTFLYGDAEAQSPFGDGILCVGGSTYRYPVQPVDAGGVAWRSIDYGALPGGSITVGSTWNFQFLYRDPHPPAVVGFNLTDGLRIPFGI